MINIAPFRNRFHVVFLLVGSCHQVLLCLAVYSALLGGCLSDNELIPLRDLTAQFAEPSTVGNRWWRLLLRKLPTLTQWTWEKMYLTTYIYHPPSTRDVKWRGNSKCCCCIDLSPGSCLQIKVILPLLLLLLLRLRTPSTAVRKLLSPSYRLYTNRY